MIVKYENQKAYTAQTYMHKCDNELRFIYGDTIEKIVFPSEKIALACMALVLEARERGYTELEEFDLGKALDEDSR